MSETSKQLQSLIETDALLADMAREAPTWWYTEAVSDVRAALDKSPIDPRIIDDAHARFQRFAPWFRAHYPDSLPTGGVLESPLVHETGYREALSAPFGAGLKGQLWFKRDDVLPVSGSVKARGGIHEVLEVAERIALDAGVLDIDGDYRAFDETATREVLAGHGITVGSTGNLGLSIGLVAAELGLQTTVHMSHDARQWKKDLLRSRGATVVEHAGDFSEAVDAGRATAAADPTVHFVDDEGSLSLFAGYAVAGARLSGQLRSLGVTVDADHPLFVYLPCGVGGAPGGITYGLKREFGEHVHCIFVEPVGAPAMSLGVRTGLHDGVSAHDLGLSGLTAADGLAVSRPSRLVGEALGTIIDGFLTVPDDQLLAQLALLQAVEGFTVEPSATAGFSAPWVVEADAAFLASRGIDPGKLRGSAHIVWCTGGSMVPAEDMTQYLAAGQEALADGALERAFRKR